MMVFTDDYEMSEEVARAVRVIAPATAFFIKNLARIVDITELSEGDDEFDYFVRVPVKGLHEIDQRIADLKFAVQDRFGVMITIMPIPVAA
ncbi:MAG: hypothetical protein QOJ39_3506 [Candidatus Eremiobacteraeota bacterium]|jgi:hypothetical protein|nr:hypothetical protein [Candidatus Eremiobacteraeota bacterium]